MGKIADRIAAQQTSRARASLAGLKSPVKPATMRSAEERQKEVDRRVEEIVKIIGNPPSSRNTMARHEYQQDKAVMAREAGVKGRYMTLCNRTDCLAPGATWYNRGSYAFYCEDCARMLNRVNRNDARELLGEGQELCIKVNSYEEAATLHVSR